MNLEDYSIVFAATSLTLILVAAFPALHVVVPFPRGGERFSELWVLGPNRMAEDYPFNVGVNETYRVFLGLGNHMGCSSYYTLYVKFRNQTQPLPDAGNSTPSPLPPLYEFRAFVADGATWEAPLTFTFLEAQLEESSFVGRIDITDDIATAAEAWISIELHDIDWVGEGDLYVNGNGPVYLPLTGNGKTATFEIDIPVDCLVNGVNEFRFGYASSTSSCGYKVNALSLTVTFGSISTKTYPCMDPLPQCVLGVPRTYVILHMSINDVVLSVNCPSRWDPENRGVYYQLFLELWLYDTSSQGFQYHNRFVGIWLNMTV